MLVTILSVVFNGESTISRTIESVMNQTYGNIEYIVIDGCSTDRTVEIVNSFSDRFNSTLGRTMRIISEPDRGMYDALNKGARLAHGELVGQINADDWYEPDAVEKMVKFYNDEKYDAAWGNIRIIKPSGEMIKRAKIGKIWTTSGWCHPAMFSRREVLVENPYAVENYADDFEFITRIKKNGYRIATIDELISNFTFGGMSTKKSMKEVKMRIKTVYGIYRKYGMSRLYWFNRVAIEMAKYVLG